MFTRDVEYTDLKNRKRTRRLMFNLTAPEIMRLEFRFDRGFRNYVVQMIEAEDRSGLFKMFELLISISYGRPNADESELIKDPEWLHELMSSKYYEELFLWLFSSETNASAFVNHIIPKDLDDRLLALQGKKAENKTELNDLSPEELELLLAKARATRSTPANAE